MFTRIGTAALIPLLCAAVACIETSRPVRYPPPAATVVPAQNTSSPPPVGSSAGAAPEAGSVALGAAMLVGGNGMASDALDRSTEDFRAVFTANLPSFRRCYGAAASRLAPRSGSIQVKIVLRADGSVYDLQHQGGTITDPGLVDCTLQAVRGMPYRPHGGQLFQVETPIEYAP
jgi:hypothetical protein